MVLTTDKQKLKTKQYWTKFLVFVMHFSIVVIACFYLQVCTNRTHTICEDVIFFGKTTDEEVRNLS